MKTRILASPLTLLLIVLTAPHSLSAQQAHVNLDWNPQANTAQLTPYGAAIISPEVHLLNDPAINEKVDYLFVGQVTLEAKPGNRTDALRAPLEKHGIEHEYYVGGGGGHDWATWRHLLHARFLPGLWRPAPPL